MNRTFATYGFLICLIVYLLSNPLQAQQQNNSSQSFINISNYYIVYDSKVNNNKEIVIYDWQKNVPWQLTQNDFEDKNPIVKNDLVIWEGITNGKESDIYMYDLEEEELVKFSTAGMNEYAPKVGGRMVAWMCENENIKSIILYDRNTKNAVAIPINKNGKDNMDLNDHYLVYRDFDGNDMEIYLYDIKKGIVKQLTNNESDDLEPVINGNFIAWRGSAADESVVYLYEITTERIKTIATNALHPRINERYIVWQQEENNSSHIAAYDIYTGSKFSIEKDELDHINPQLSGQYLMWYGIGTNTAKLYVQNMESETIQSFDVQDYKNTQPTINGDMIVWKATDSDENEIYLFSLR